MPFLLLLILTLTCFQREWPAPPEWLGGSGSVVLMWGAMALCGTIAGLAATCWHKQLERNPGVRSQLIERYSIFRRWHVYVLLSVYFLLVCVGGWGWFVVDGL